MSGIAGIFARGGSPVPAEAGVVTMLAAMAHRGPDGTSVLSDANAAIGLAHLDTSNRRIQAPAIERLGPLAIVADCRLYGREMLVAGLGQDCAATAPGHDSDAKLILLAYRRWGENCLARLEGDFAFAIWDRDSLALFCARDRFGVKPFQYHCSDRRFAFASETGPILATGVPMRINDDHVAGFLAGLPDDPATTPYLGVSRLPPHHCLTVTRDGFAVRSYWELQPRARGPRRDTADEFRELFTRAVATRLKDEPAAGAMLSGGLDSSSICSVARGLTGESQPLPTFSLTFEPGSSMDERRHVEAVLAAGGLEGNPVEVGDYAPFGEMAVVVAEQEGPFLAPGLTLTRRLFHAARRRGVRVLLDGHGGDEVVSHGYGRLHQLAAERRLVSLWKECRGASAIFGAGTSELFAHLWLSHAAGPRTRGLAARGRRFLRARSPADAEARDWRELVDPHLSGRTSLVERYRRSGVRPRDVVCDETRSHRWNLTNGLVPHGLEVLDRAAARAGVEPRYPFLDRALVEFCLSVPPEDKLSGGWSRLVLRRAMQDILPSQVQWRRDKIDFRQSLAAGMARHHRGSIDKMLGREAGLIAGYVNVAGVRAAFGRVAADPAAAGMEDLQHVWRAAVLSTWLSQFEHGRIAA